MRARFLLLFSAIALAFAAFELTIGVEGAAAAACCTYGSDCSTGQECCLPGPGMADCSKAKPYYCRTDQQC